MFMNIDLKQISKILSYKTGRKIEITEIKQIPGGNEAESFKLTDKKGKKFFLKRVKQKAHGKFKVEQNMHWFLISNSMMDRSSVSSNGLGIFIQKKRRDFFLLFTRTGIRDFSCARI